MAGTVETLVIGASAAGLATAAELHRRGREFEILEAEDVVAASWRRHYDRLHLHTPKGFSALPGLPMPKSWPRYPARDQVVEYLELYQKHFALRPRFGETVHRVDRVNGIWETTTSTGTWRSANVVIATGRARVPVRPTWPERISTEVTFSIRASTAMETHGRVGPFSWSVSGTRLANKHWISSNVEPRSISPCVHPSTSYLVTSSA